MITTYLGMLVGLLLGGAAGGPLGAALGLMVGGACGMTWAGVTNAVAKPRPGAELVREDVNLLCVPKGQVAAATFVRETGTGRWLDVERCTLCTPQDEVTCQKRCLLLVRDTLPARRHPVVQPTA